MKQIPNRKQMLAEEDQRAQLYLRSFDARRYGTYYARLSDPYAYLDEIGIDKICELIELGNGLLNVAEHLDLSSTTLRKWVNRSPANVEKMNLAKTFAGDAFAYRAEKVLDALSFASKEEISVAFKKVDHYHWMATRLYKEQYGDSKAAVAPNGNPMVLNLTFAPENGLEGMKVVSTQNNLQKVQAKGMSLDFSSGVEAIDVNE